MPANSIRSAMASDTALILTIEGVAELMHWSGACSEREGRKRLAIVAEQWRELFEHVR